MAEIALATIPDSDLAHVAGVERAPVRRLIPVLAQFAELFVDGGLRRGSTVTVVGSTAVALGLVAHATQTGLWCAGVGLANLGVVAAADLGVELERLALVPDPGADWPTVVAALIDGFDVVILQADSALAPGITRRLEARLRQRGAVIVLIASMPNAWSQTDLVIRQVEVKCQGLGQGHGNLIGQTFTVMSQGRGAANRPRRAVVALP